MTTSKSQINDRYTVRSNDSPNRDYLLKALISGVSCAITGAVLNPIDVVKIRMMNDSPQFPWPQRQLRQSMLRIYEEEGTAGFCRGLSATVMRE